MQISCRPYTARARTIYRFLSAASDVAARAEPRADRPVGCICGLGGTGGCVFTVIKTGATGLVMGILYLGTGSLLFPVILHAAVDLQGGAIARRALGSVQNAEAA